MSTNQKKLDALLASGHAIFDKADREGRLLTPHERSTLDGILTGAKSAKDARDLDRAIENLGAGDMGWVNAGTGAKGWGSVPAAEFAGGFAAAVTEAGWDRISKPRVMVPAKAALLSGRKTASFSGDIEDEDPAARRTGAPLGADQRFLYTAVRLQPVDAEITSVPSIRQSSRTLGSGDLGLRDIDAVETKHEIASEAEVISVVLQGIAHIESEVPNVLLQNATFLSFVNVDLRLAFSETVDYVVTNAIETSTPPSASGENMLEAILAAVAAVQAAGYSPNVLAASPDDLLALALLRQPTSDDYVAGAMDSLLSGLRRVAAKGVVTPMVLDTSAAGVLYLSPVTFGTFEENAGQTNTSTIRIEAHGAFNVERGDAICEATITT